MSGMCMQKCGSQHGVTVDLDSCNHCRSTHMRMCVDALHCFVVACLIDADGLRGCGEASGDGADM